MKVFVYRNELQRALKELETNPGGVALEGVPIDDRTVVQISGGIALCRDGSLWELGMLAGSLDKVWRRLPSIPS